MAQDLMDNKISRPLGKPKDRKSPSGHAPADFTKAFFANVMASDLANFPAQDREKMAASIWHLAQHKELGRMNLRLFNPSPVADGWTVDHTVLEIVNDDMPFLVDSVTGALQGRGLTIHLVIHPILQVQRQADGKLVEIVKNISKVDNGNKKPVLVGAPKFESFMHIEFDHCLDPSLLKEIEADIRSVLSDVRASVDDWSKMRDRMREAIEQAVASKHQKESADDTDEVRAFMRWLDDNNFTYLGYRDIDLVQEQGKLVSIKVLPKSGLGILRDPEVRMFGGLRDLGAKQSPTLQLYVRQNHLLVVTKTNHHSRVHRTVPMDAVFIRRFDTEGNIIGERLFVGLFTSQSYSQSPFDIPFLRRKIEKVIGDAKLNPSSHDGKALVHILNHYPHDELFQITEEELLHNALGILQLQERARVALFLRRDPFSRFVTCLIYVPRDRYDSSLRARLQQHLEASFGGQAEDWHVRIDDSLLARAFVTIRTTSKQPDIGRLENELREMCRRWPDRLRDSLAAEYGEATALALMRRYGDAFPVAYCDAVSPALAVQDIHNLERGKSLAANRLVVDLAPPDAAGLLHLKLFGADRPIALSEALPLIENAGIKVTYMGGPYEVRPRDSERSIFIHEFVGRTALPAVVEFRHLKATFEEAFGKIWTGEIENDPFNALTLRAGMAWRDVVVLRAFARYLRQLRIPYSHEMMAQTFLKHPHVAQQMYALFFVRHNPDLKGDRHARCHELENKIVEELGKIDALEEDRIIRRYLNLVQSSLRTNFFQAETDGSPKTYLSIKFDSRAVEFMPLPKPLFEIFVYSTRTEAVHLRGGKVARGGIRWSDRRDDFRNEILGLMKAQQVKNSVIVPVGSKGGFIVKHPPAEADKLGAEGIACYRIMMCGMLDITDNRVGTKIQPPARVVRHDQDDPYLVVAADKGTAKFSDIANGIAQEYKFWLDDAFASGGSAGYDHKGMGITARGTWEAVKRHFRELGKDIQTTDFTCIGVGDMSGDVFGNGMLLSKHILLLSAFDHRHIFCDPSPDPAVSFAERQRLFNLPRSSWADYDSKKISKGGGIFARSEKTIKISPEMKKAFGITADSLPPTDLIQAMLKAEVELLYFGGIGTYVKGTSETNEEIGDRATEQLRVDGADVRAKVIGEGANLGMTQHGRVEYALKGGHLNTDAIDNSAGVDTSDHEVNIKILLRKLVDQGEMTLPARNKLLASMTDEVGDLVLRDNYMQTQTLSIMESKSSEFLQQNIRCMHILEKSGLLNRDVEFLPHSAELAERERMSKGLTRPELAVLLAYGKIWLYQQLIESDLPDDDYMQDDLATYFPDALRKKYGTDIEKHQLAREIIATVITNSTVNRGGNHFVMVMADRTGQTAAEVTRAYILARETFSLRALWAAIEDLDNKVPAKVQIHMHLVVRQMMVDAVYWFLTEYNRPQKLAPAMKFFGKGVEHLAIWLKKRPPELNSRYKREEAELTEHGVPAALAQRIVLMPVLGTALDLTRLADQSGASMDAIAEVFFGLGKRLGIDWLTEHARTVVAQTPWQREAIAAILGDLISVQRQLTDLVIGKNKDKHAKAPSAKLADWLERHSGKLERYDMLLTEWRTIGSVDMAMLTLASRQLAALV